MLSVVARLAWLQHDWRLLCQTRHAAEREAVARRRAEVSKHSLTRRGCPLIRAAVCRYCCCARICVGATAIQVRASAVTS